MIQEKKTPPQFTDHRIITAGRTYSRCALACVADQGVNVPQEHFNYGFTPLRTNSIQCTLDFDAGLPHQRQWVFLRYNPVVQAMELSYEHDPRPWKAPGLVHQRRCLHDTHAWLAWILYTDQQRIQLLHDDPRTELVWSDQVNRLDWNYLVHRMGGSQPRDHWPKPWKHSLNWLVRSQHRVFEELTDKYRSEMIQRTRRLKNRNQREHNLAIDFSIIHEHREITKARRCRS